ncbi:MAG: GerMN domain-containing protein [Deltaproteobacteria bacterium]|nr:GerMN domain-containing protein [Deltaproteobacteria bacterium]
MPPQKKKGSAKKRTSRKRPERQAGGRGWLLGVLLVILVFSCSAIYLYKHRTGAPLTAGKGIVAELIETFRSFTDTYSAASWEATLYFGDENSDLLVREVRTVSSTGQPEHRGEALIAELLRGPRAGGVRTIPEGTELRELTLADNGVMVADFSPEMSSFHPGGTSSELMTVFSIVNTLTSNITGVERVTIRIDGKKAETIAGHIDCREAFLPNKRMIK